nr:fumarylacetoacetate hydrolase family protein [Acidobacteriota bacterium]
MLLYRIAPEGFYAVSDPDPEPGSAPSLRILYSDPFATLPGGWELGHGLELAKVSPLAPVLPGKIVGIGRNYREHAREMGNEVPGEPLLFLKSPGSVVGPNVPVVLPPESAHVEFEGEIALVLRARLR